MPLSATQPSTSISNQGSTLSSSSSASEDGNNQSTSEVTSSPTPFSESSNSSNGCSFWGVSFIAHDKVNKDKARRGASCALMSFVCG